jgi:low molecular weight protein-tyrosine phosphatase
MRKLLRHSKLEAQVRVESAGTLGYHQGDPPDRRAQAAARARGVALTSRARQFAPADWKRFDYVVAMDQQNFEDLAASAPDAEARAKLWLLRAFDPTAPRGAVVPDPYHGGPDGFEQVLDLCEAACQGLVEHLRREHDL